MTVSGAVRSVRATPLCAACLKLGMRAEVAHERALVVRAPAGASVGAAVVVPGVDDPAVAEVADGEDGRPVGPRPRHARVPEAERGGFGDVKAALERDVRRQLIEETDIWNIVYETIMSYDEQKLVLLTRQVANRELRGVTLWGGVIGAVVGVAMSLVMLVIS